MHDSRINNKVERNTPFSILFWWIKYKFWIKKITALIVIVSLIINPESVITKIATWINTIYTTFIGISTITIQHWVVMMGTVFASLVMYRLYKWGSKD